MGVLDKFLDIMKLSDDDDDYENDDFFDEDDLDDYEEKPKRKLFGRDKKNDEEETFFPGRGRRVRVQTIIFSRQQGDTYETFRDVDRRRRAWKYA